MAHNEIYPSGVSHTCLGIEWNSASYTTYVTIAPTIWRWDEANTANTGGRWSESLSPDPQGAGYWSGLSWGTGYGWRQIDSFATRTYNRTKSSQTVKLTITTDASYGTYWYGWVNYGTKSVSWTLTIDPLPSYNVTFNANSGSGAPATQKKWYNENLTLSSTKPTRTGYTFKQWNTKADGTGTAYAPGASYTGNAKLDLYAIWTINTWTVAYNANGHGTAPASQTKTYGTNLTLRSGMGTVSNYVWKSWNTAANGSGTTYGSGAAYSTNGAATMYAQWYAPYTVSYNANGGTGAPAAQTKIYNQTLTLSATIPTRANHDFLGWATSATAETPTYRTGDNHSGNVTYSTNAALSLYAVWKIAHSNPTISYLNVKRCVSPQDGTPADDGEGCLIMATVAIDNTTEGYFDTVIRSVTVQVGSNAPETVTVGASDTTAQIEFVSSHTLLLTSTYAVKVTVEDSYGFSSYKTSNVSIAYFTMHFKEGGHGIAIGKKSTVDNLFDVNMNTKVAGYLTAKASNLDRNGAAPAANTFSDAALRVFDKDDSSLFYLDDYIRTDGYNISRIITWNEKDNTPSYVGLEMQKPRTSVNNDGYLWFGGEGSFGQRIKLRANSSNFGAIRFESQQLTHDSIKFYGGDEYGSELVMGASGRTIIGAGESPAELHNELIAAGSGSGIENMYVTSDGQICLYSHANTMGSKTLWTMLNAASPQWHGRCAADMQAYINNSSNNGTSANVNLGQIAYMDKNGLWAGNFGTELNGSAGKVRSYLGLHNKKTDGTEISSWFCLDLNKDGTSTYSIPTPANFRSAIGAAASSDRRLKHDITILGEDAVQFVKDLEPCVYTINGERQVGFIAQDIAGCDPWGTRMAFETEEGLDGLDDWEKMPDGSATWKLDYIRTIPPIAAALKKAMERIDLLEARIEELENGAGNA